MTGITISRLSFNCGKAVDLSPNDIVVFVGPNNMGKSQVLKDTFNLISSDKTGTVLNSVEIAYHNAGSLPAKVARLSLKTENGPNTFYQGYHFNIIEQLLSSVANHPQKLNEEIKKFLVSMIKTDERLTTAAPKQMVSPGRAPDCPLQYVTIDENRDAMSRLFQEIFAQHIYCEDRGSIMLTLHVGEEIRFDHSGMSTQEIVDEQYKRIRLLPKVDEQGDGVRSLAGLLLNLMMPNYSIFLMDEPEAFLHPPQAKVLGQNLPQQLGDRQALISTHSVELIKGLLTSAPHRVKIIRITRRGTINPINSLSSADVDSIWKDSIMRHTNILDSIFYHHTVLCESDSDCLLYSAVLDHLNTERGYTNDSLLIHCGGKGRMHKVVAALRSLGVDYRVIPDIDIYNDRHLTKLLYESCGGSWKDVEADYSVLENYMDQPAGVLLADDVVKNTRDLISKRGWKELRKAEVKRLSSEMNSMLDNKWDELKHSGISMIEDAEALTAMNNLLKAFNQVGIFPVIQGELENFIPGVGNHGPSWAVSVMEQFPDMRDAIYKELKEFVGSWNLV